MRVLVTGCAGFLGMHCAQRLLARGDEVFGADSLSPYYSVELKRDRLRRLEADAAFRFEPLDLAQGEPLARFFDAVRPERVLHLAAQPGVRYSLENPASYVQSNLVAFANLLECCRRRPPQHLVYASSSSVYGVNPKLPWTESDRVDQPISLYAATKKANELMAHVYSHLHGLPTSGLRYFTVYGPWGRPDMSPMLFARAILEGTPIQVFNHGDMRRDFTYVDDAVEATMRVLERPLAATPPARVLNVGNRQPVPLLEYIALLERALGRTAVKEMKPMQPGDVPATYADTRALEELTDFAPATPLAEGLARFAEWVRRYYRYA
ncbi:MAG: NAD-dependent epimerase/dehydratase family protein [Betaproteobacteria bacterium]|nr:NAD-dependent epimerase/dehydratase family protein [Betaproteobacteria bacterium]MDH5219714.1 NAD-dependent epimerase/dehydratase family protein [Betaproteobacteria bacterium]MDH5350719.1 NAD-dependent epimerase/dehydratase family protein [Betaproteobacteria bacterium]